MRLIMRVLNRLVVEGIDKAISNPAIDKFIQEQFDQLLKSSKLHELVERVSFKEDISKEQALNAVLDRFAFQANETSKKKGKAAASLELILR